MRRSAPVLATVMLMGQGMEAKERGKPNALIAEKSPYLQQHAYNPVDWRPWGEEAFEKARREDKPVFLSIGYSTCHWCHVMERESFEDPATAELLNRHFVSIKVDREERPDVDRLYMTAVQAMTGQGGWPLNAFLTPDLKPFYGGTYFPPSSRWGLAGFPEVLERVAQMWKEDRAKLVSSGEELGRALKGFAEKEGGGGRPDPRAIDKAVETLASSFDGERGGFGTAPKFPMPVNINLLLRAHSRTGRRETLDMALETLRAMAKGGIRDHLGGGFHRYSTDARWHVPHFEKMLYDNAQIAVNYVEAYQVTREEDFARVARGTLDYVLRDMTHPEGGFFSAEDADSEGVEGAFYVWTKDEILDLLGGKDGEAFCRRYGVEAGGNAAHDPHGEFSGKNILYEAQSGPEPEGLDRSRRRLFEARSKRPRPLRDDKVLTSWNGLMISALAKAGAVLEEDSYAKAAEKAAGFIRRQLYDSGEKRLSRRWREGERKVPGMADDYAFLAQGALDLYEVSFDPRWLFWAEELTDVLDELFLDRERGGYYMTAPGHDERLLTRVRDDSDNVEPAAGSVAALTHLRLSWMLDRKDLLAAAEKTLSSQAEALSSSPRAWPQMLVALDLSLAKPRQIVVAGRPGSSDTRELLRRVRGAFRPHDLVFTVGDEERAALAPRLAWIKGMVPLKGKAAAYVCVDFKCSLPTTDPEQLSRSLEGIPSRP